MAARRTARRSSTRAGATPCRAAFSSSARDGRPRGRPVSGRRHGQPVAALDLPRGSPQPRVVVARPDPPEVVLPDQDDRDVDVVVGVPHRHPPRPASVSVLGDPGTAQQRARDRRPLPVGQDPVARRDARRAVPHVAALARSGARRRQPGRDRRRLQRRDQRPQHEPTVRADGGLPRRVPAVPRRDHPRVRVLLRPPRTHQVADQPGRPPAVHDLRDHDRRARRAASLISRSMRCEQLLRGRSLSQAHELLEHVAPVGRDTRVQATLHVLRPRPPTPPPRCPPPRRLPQTASNSSSVSRSRTTRRRGVGA